MRLQVFEWALRGESNPVRGRLYVCRLKWQLQCLRAGLWRRWPRNRVFEMRCLRLLEERWGNLFRERRLLQREMPQWGLLQIHPRF
jgi:hypothetical protein